MASLRSWVCFIFALFSLVHGAPGAGPTDTVEIVSEGDAGIHRKNRMGTYIKTNQLARGYPVFEQAVQEEGNNKYFLFVGPGGTWRVGPDITSYSGSLLKYPKSWREETPNQPPKSGWLYYLNNKWNQDDTLQVIVHVDNQDDTLQVIVHVDSVSDTTVPEIAITMTSAPATTTTYQGCVTVGGGEIGASCVFPWFFNGVQYNGCTTFGDDSPICSTSVDPDGVHVNGMGKWGYCGSNCKMHTAELTLVGGNVLSEGNVLFDGKPVCHDEWGEEEGRVVCKELGFPGFVRVTKKSHFGSVSSNFGMDDVRCAGDEESLQDCYYTKDENCGSSEGAGVICWDVFTDLRK